MKVEVRRATKPQFTCLGTLLIRRAFPREKEPKRSATCNKTFNPSSRVGGLVCSRAATRGDATRLHRNVNVPYTSNDSLVHQEGLYQEARLRFPPYRSSLTASKPLLSRDSGRETFWFFLNGFGFPVISVIDFSDTSRPGWQDFQSTVDSIRFHK